MTLTIFVIGRVIFSIFWLNTAYNHLFKSAGLIGYSQSKGVKAPKIAVMGSGILALIGGASMLLGFWPKIGIIALVLFLLGVSIKIHNYWNIPDPMAKMTERVQFMKNMAILAALLMMFMIATPWPFSI